MANETYKLISSATVGASPASSIDFNNIPQTYTDLQLVISARCSAADTSLRVRFNGVTTNYQRYYLETNVQNAPGAGTGSDNFYANINNSGFTSNIFANSKVNILNYTSSNPKVAVSVKNTENNATLDDIGFNTGYWNNSSAITSISLIPNSGNFVQYSTAYLYGIVNTAGTDVGPQATGGTVTSYTSGGTTYYVHSFTGTGTFTPSKQLTIDYLVVAGGGGGADSTGGGAGGMLDGTTTANATAYTCTVGGAVNRDTGGQNSSLIGTGISITSTGGGGGRSGSGGSGAGGCGAAGGNGIAGQGTNGGTGTSGNKGGGGGGSANAGVTNAQGGNGRTNSIRTGSPINYAGGGGGRNDNTTYAGGSGGGGSSASTGNPGGTNTGGGGGAGTPNGYLGGGGGSGIIVIRYAV